MADASIATKTLTSETFVNQLFKFQLPPEAFPLDGKYTASYTAFLQGRSPLPAWLTFDRTTRSLSGTPTKAELNSLSARNISIEVVANYSEGSRNVDYVTTIELTLRDNSLTRGAAIPDKGSIIGSPFNAQIFDDAFITPNQNPPTYSATLADGTPLPQWLTFNPTTRIFSGTPSLSDYGIFNINVRATDPSNVSAVNTFVLTVDIDAAQYGASYSNLITTYGFDTYALSQHYRNFGRAAGLNPDLFDENRYVASNPDLIGTFDITDPTTRLVNADKAAEHYIRYGYDQKLSLTSFQPDQYIASYGDLIQSIGYNLNAGDVHYIQHGTLENRPIDQFDEYRYLAAYDDLLNTYKTDVTGATQHYIVAGFKEGRTPYVFNSDVYLASYSDLLQGTRAIANYASKLQFATQHYVFSGRGEGRSRAIFNPQTYLAKNPDLASYGTLAALTEHYIEHGYFEGRTF